MRKKVSFSLDQKNLIRRYLLWAYKTTKEGFERIERKSTQLIVDEYVRDHFLRNKLGIPEDFGIYIANKRKDELKLKYADTEGKGFHPEYIYLKNRLAAIESAVKHFLGNKELKRMQKLFEEEFIRRILESREH